jgi:hypothetical protein
MRIDSIWAEQALLPQFAMQANCPLVQVDPTDGSMPSRAVNVGCGFGTSSGVPQARHSFMLAPFSADARRSGSMQKNQAQKSGSMQKIDRSYAKKFVRASEREEPGGVQVTKPA